MKAAIKSNYLIGDMVYVEMPTFVGYAKVSGVDNRPDGIYYYLTNGPSHARNIIVAHESEVFEGAPVAKRNTYTGVKANIFFIARGKYDERD